MSSLSIMTRRFQAPIRFDQREGFAAMLQWIAANGVTTVIVETANRFAQDLIIQETRYRLLKERGIDLIAADAR